MPLFQNSSLINAPMIDTLAVFAYATPLGLNTVIMPAVYGGDTGTDACMALVSHVLCVITIPLIYGLVSLILNNKGINMIVNTEYKNNLFYKSENLKRYTRYSAINPHMSSEEIIWRVNNNLDKEKYEFDVPVEDCDSLYVIVNKYFKLPFDYCPRDLVEADGVLMRKHTAAAYIKMRDAAKDEGFSIKVTSAYRSADEQQKIYNRFLVGSTVPEVDKTCARPCYSEHQTGLAVDIEGSVPGGRNISKTPEALWLKENSYKFGFILRYLADIVDITGYASEPWHFRYVGIKVSTDMKEKNIKSFEEYRERYL